MVRFLSRQGREGGDIDYRIDKYDHDVVDALRRIARAQIEGALASAQAGGEAGGRVHDIRKRTKKLRALIRLVRPVFPDFEAEDAAFRDIARTVAGARDAAVTALTLGRLVEGADDADLAALREDLAAAVPQAPDLAPTAEGLALALGRVPLWTLRETGWDAVAGGLHRTYRSARRRRSARGDEALHAWRKPVKYHMYHLRLLAGIREDEMAARERAADALAEALGDHQDLAVLDARLRGHLHGAPLPKPSRKELARRIDDAKAAAEAQARKLAPRVLGDKPGALVACWGAHWAAWRG